MSTSAQPLWGRTASGILLVENREQGMLLQFSGIQGFNLSKGLSMQGKDC